jgi:copper chaperone
MCEKAVQRTVFMRFTVSGMTCGGCINAVTRAIQAVDPKAQVKVDLATQLIELHTVLSISEAQQLIEDAGFPISKTL